MLTESDIKNILDAFEILTCRTVISRSRVGNLKRVDDTIVIENGPSLNLAIATSSHLLTSNLFDVSVDDDGVIHSIRLCNRPIHEERIRRLEAELQPYGIAWRSDSSMMQNYVIYGSPDIAYVVETMRCMKFLIERTIYRYIRDTVPRDMRRAMETDIRINSIRHFIDTGGNRAEIPPQLLQIFQGSQ